MFEFLKICGKLILSLTTVLLLIFLVFRVFDNKINDINKKKYMKIVDRLQITKDNSLVIVKIGKKGYIMSSSAHNIQKIEEIEEGELELIEDMKKQAFNDMQSFYDKAFIKLKGIKGDKHEK